MYTKLTEEIQMHGYQVHGIEIFRDGETIFTHHFAPNVRYPIYSATKAFTSTAVGLAVAEGKLSVDAPLSAYLERRYLQYVPEAQREAFAKLPIRRFLTMSIPGYPFRPEGADWLQFALEYPVDYGAAPVFDYSNIPAYLAGVAVEHAVGEHLGDYLKSRLFEPLGIHNPVYQKCPAGHFYGASGMELTVHELSLLGQLYLQKGQFQGTQILPEWWVQEAASVQLQNREGGYGYYFWKYGQGYRISGKWGQRCLIFPAQLDGQEAVTDGAEYSGRQDSLMVTYLSNMQSGSGRVTELIEEYVLRRNG